MILHVIALNRVGGVETSFVGVFRSDRLQDLDQVAIVTCPPGSPYEGFCAAQGDRVRCVASTDRGPIPRYVARVRGWKEALRVRRPGAIVFWNTIPSLSWFALIRMALPQAELIYYERGRGWLARRTWQNGRVLQGMDRVLCNSNAARRVLEERWSRRSEVVVLKNPIPTEHAAPAVRERTMRDGRVRIGVSARLIPVKGVELALHATRILRDDGVDCELMVAGEGPLIGALQRLAENLEISPWCRFLGIQRDMARFYDDLDVLMVPSLREPFGLISIEAQSWGVPVVVSRVDGLPETIVEGTTGHSVPTTLPIEAARSLGCDVTDLPELVYDPVSDRLRAPMAPSPSDLAEAVARVLIDPAAYRRMSRAASLHALSTFGFTAYAERLRRILLECRRS